MTEETRNALMKLAEQDRANAADNLWRARAASRGCDPTKPYGQNTQTLNEIIAGYQDWHDKATAVIEELRGAK